MTPGVIADSIVNLCGAIGLGVAMITFYRRDRKSPLTRRLLLLLGMIAILFLIRGAAWWTGSALLDRLSMVPAALIPLGALILTEGLLRRHAPRAIKLSAVIGAILLGLIGLFGPERFETPYSIAVSLFQLAGFATCALLLAMRDRASLIAPENRNIIRLAVGALMVIPFLITDFRALFPDIPVRLGAMGALLVVSLSLLAGSGADTRRHGLAIIVLRLFSSLMLGIGAAFMSPDVDAAQVMRYAAVAVTGVLTIGLMTDTLRSFFEAQEPGVLNSVAASPAQTREALIAELARHHLFESAKRYRESELSDYDPALLRDFLVMRRVLRRQEAPWGLNPIDPAVERIVSLMTANSATHVIVLGHDPIDLIVLSVPVISADPATETALALVRRLLALTPEAA